MSVSLRKRERTSDLLIENHFIAESLREVSDLLDQQRASVFRVRAFRDAARYIENLPHPIRDIHTKAGVVGIEALPIRTTTARSIVELLETGSLLLVHKLLANRNPEKLFQSVPMIGWRLACNIHDQLNIDSLEALEEAAYDGRLMTLKGVGECRVKGIRRALAEILEKRRPRLHKVVGKLPPIMDILNVDCAYRAALDHLPTDSHQKLETAGSLNLSILHTEHNKWRFTAICSNTPAARNYKQTRDWVAVYFEQDEQAEGQCTVVTEHRGPLKGKRVIRGREPACGSYYRRNSTTI